MGCHSLSSKGSSRARSQIRVSCGSCIAGRFLIAEPLEVKVKSLSRVRLFATPWTVTYQASPSMGFSRQEYWSGLPFPSPTDLPDPGIEPGSPALEADTLTSEPPGKPMEEAMVIQSKLREENFFSFFFMVGMMRNIICYFTNSRRLGKAKNGFSMSNFSSSINPSLPGEIYRFLASFSLRSSNLISQEFFFPLSDVPYLLAYSFLSRPLPTFIPL